MNLNALPQETAYYLYGFADADALPKIEGAGLDAISPLETVRVGRLCAVYSAVRLSEIAALQDREESALLRLTEFACRHEAVVEQMMAHSPVLPMRFGALFTHPRSVRAALERHAPAIAAFLRQVENADEWSIKGYLDREAALVACRSALDTANGANETLSPGRRYLEQKRKEARAREQLDDWLEIQIRPLLARLCESALTFRMRPRPTMPASESREWRFNAAFLVERSRENVFEAAFEQAQRESALLGLRVERTGPWPPYTFVPELDCPPAEKPGNLRIPGYGNPDFNRR
jgi:hypothetical protein